MPEAIKVEKEFSINLVSCLHDLELYEVNLNDEGNHNRGMILIFVWFKLQLVFS